MRHLVEGLGLWVLRRVDPERAHALAIRGLRAGLAPRPGTVTSDRLKVSVGGLDLPNPVGLAAGFDKNAEAVGPLSRAGFGFVELGAATPRPQAGNPRPRLWRLPEAGAVINRFGFNNDGVEAIATRLEATPRGVPRGLNLGANKDSPDRAADFAEVMARVRDAVDFATVNVSSPNTERLRDLQGADALAALLDGVKDAARGTPVFLKIAPDLDTAALADVAAIADAAGIAGIVATNTTLARYGLTGARRDLPGGLSGRPLFARSTRVLARLSTLTDLPLIGVGGVESPETAYEKIRAGATAVQLYTALSRHGLSLADRIARGLDALLARDGFGSVAEAVGTGRQPWL